METSKGQVIFSCYVTNNIYILFGSIYIFKDILKMYIIKAFRWLSERKAKVANIAEKMKTGCAFLAAMIMTLTSRVTYSDLLSDF